jgi:hypothetical protein
MSTISFEAILHRSEEAGTGNLLRLPEEASAKLPSRGMAAVEGTMNGVPFRAVLEPDGQESHWFTVNTALLEAAGVGAGDTVVMTIEPAKECPEPKVPADLLGALTADPEAHAVWTDITPMARWDWVRWIGSAKQPETRKRRVDSVCSRLKAGKRRPCCFDRNQCTLTEA